MTTIDHDRTFVFDHITGIDSGLNIEDFYRHMLSNFIF